MKKVSKKTLVAELQRRNIQKEEESSKKQFSLSEFCFPEQLKFIEDKSKFKTAVCSRRAGKTVACAADLFNTAMTMQGDVAYITLNRRTAKRIIWKELVRLVNDFGLNAKIDNTDLSITLPNNNTIYISGAKDSEEIEKFRGVALRKIYIDECQSFKPYIKELVEDVLENCLTDYDGSLILIGTPGPVPVGFFYDATHSKGWSHHKWTMHNNPWIKSKSGKDPEEIIRERAERRGVPLSDPSILREYFGQWVHDENSLVYKYDERKNHFDNFDQSDKSYDYIIGIDIGFNDADAIAVLAYSNDTGKSFLVEEDVQRKQDISSLATKIKYYQQKYNPIKMVIDAGALGKKIQEELIVRFQLNIAAAEKTRKFEFIELLNSDLLTGKLMAKKESLFAQDAKLVQWDRDTPGKLKISDSFHSDICDAVLYAWRECKHYYMNEIKHMPNKNSSEYGKYLEEKTLEKLLEQENKEWWEDL